LIDRVFLGESCVSEMRKMGRSCSRLLGELEEEVNFGMVREGE
jgi:hypothetical protein